MKTLENKSNREERLKPVICKRNIILLMTSDFSWYCIWIYIHKKLIFTYTKSKTINCFSCALDKIITNNKYYNTLHNVLLYTSNKTICVFHGIFADNPYFSVRFRICIFYAGNNCVVEETKYSSHKHLRIKTVNTFIWGKHQVVNPRRNNHCRCSPHMKEIIV